MTGTSRSFWFVPVNFCELYFSDRVSLFIIIGIRRPRDKVVYYTEITKIFDCSANKNDWPSMNVANDAAFSLLLFTIHAVSEGKHTDHTGGGHTLDTVTTNMSYFYTLMRLYLFF